MQKFSYILNKLRLPYSNDYVFGVIFLLIILVPLAFVPYLSDSFESVKVTLLVLGVATACLNIVFQKKAVVYNKKLLILGVLFVTWSVVSTFFSIDYINSIIGLYGRYTSSVIFYSIWVLLIVIFWSNGTRDKYIYWAKTLFAVSGVIALFGIIQNTGFAFYAGFGADAIQRVPSFLGNPNFSSMFIASVLPFGIIFLPESGFWKRVYYIVVSILIVWAVVLFGSRGSIIALVVEFVLLIGFFWKFSTTKRFIYIALTYLAVMLVCLGLFFGIFRPGSVSQTLNLSETTVQSRFVVWDATLKVIASHPWVGTGPANLFIGLRQLGSPLFANGERFDDAHNIFLHLAAVSGLVFLVIFCTIIILSIWIGWKKFVSHKDPLVVAGLVALIGLLFSACFNPVVVPCWFLLAFLIALLSSSNNLEEYIITNSSIRPAVITVLFALIIAGILFITGQAFGSAGLRHYRANDYTQAYRYNSIALKLNPLDEQALVFKAGSAIHLNQPPQTTQNLINRTIRLHPNASGTYNAAQNLYIMLFIQTQDSKYLADYESMVRQTLKNEPSHISQLNQIAYLYYILGEPDKAINYSRQSLTIDPSQFYPWLLLTKIYQQKAERPQALYALKMAYQLQPYLTVVKTWLENSVKEPDISKWNIPILLPRPEI